MVRFQDPEDNLSQENEAKTRRTLCYYQSTVGLVTYRLKLLTSWQIHNVFHVTLLKPYRENEIYGENFTEPPPELVEGEEVYKVETIHGHRNVQWQSYPISNASWELEHAFSDDGKILADYKKHHL